MTIEQELIKAQGELNAASQDLAIAKSNIAKLTELLETSNSQLATMTAARDELSASLKTEKEARAAESKANAEAIAAKEAEVEKRANLKLHERCSQLGIKPVKDEPTASTAFNDIEKMIMEEKDPTRRTQLYRDNKDKIRTAAIIRR